ncbi:MAG: SDR family oxidoreductase [Pseudomonadota bacterium]
MTKRTVLRAVSILLFLLPAGYFGLAGAQSAYQPTVLVTGANRGMGLEYARQYAAMGYRVIATARSPDRADDLKALAAADADVIVERLDVTDHAAIEALGAKYRQQPIDILVNNAGVSGGASQNTYDTIDYEDFDLAIAVNTYGPLKMATVFMPHVMASEQKKIIAVSSNMSPIANTFGGVYVYRVSKAALNMAYRTLAMDVRDDGVIVGLITPPQTNTDLQPPGVDRSKLPSAKESVAGMIRNIERFTLENSGSFYGHEGVELPW